MEQTISGFITQFPNLAVALWVLFQQQLTIKALMGNQQRLIERLMDASEIDDATAKPSDAFQSDKSTP